MILVGDPQNKPLSEAISKKAGISVFYPEVTIFPDTEQRVRILQGVQGEKIYVLKSVLRPVDSSILQLTFTVDALNRSGADKAIGIIPYIPYMRANHIFRTGEAVPLEVVIKMIEDSGLHEIIMVDPHSIKIPEMFKIPVHNLSALETFAQKIKEIEPKKENITIVSPDMGGIRRLKLVDEMLGGVNQVIINKDRNYESGEVRVAEYTGEIRGKCFIIDDIISTGKTVVQAIDTLIEGGASMVYVFATHPVFSENASELLSKSRAKKIFVTDSIPVPPEKRFEKLEILSIAGLVAQELKT